MQLEHAAVHRALRAALVVRPELAQRVDGRRHRLREVHVRTAERWRRAARAAVVQRRRPATRAVMLAVRVAVVAPGVPAAAATSVRVRRRRGPARAAATVRIPAVRARAVRGWGPAVRHAAALAPARGAVARAGAATALLERRRGVAAHVRLERVVAHRRRGRCGEAVEVRVRLCEGLGLDGAEHRAPAGAAAAEMLVGAGWGARAAWAAARTWSRGSATFRSGRRRGRTSRPTVGGACLGGALVAIRGVGGGRTS